MDKQHKRKKRRRRLQKPDAINVILASITLVLLLTWGGLHWKESSEQKLLVHADGGEQVLVSEEGVGSADSEEKGLAPEGEAEPSATDEIAATPETQAEAGTETPVIDEEKSNLPTNTKPAAPDKNNNNGNAQATKPTSTVKPNTKPGSKPEAELPSTTEKPGTAVTPPPVVQTGQYEQEIIELQASCTQDMNEVLVNAEESMAQLDKTDPYALLAFNDKVAKQLADVGSACDNKFQEITVRADKASVSPEVIKEWQQAYGALMEKLKGEFEAKLMKLL
ncbi:hypothetical protein FHS15_004689 [Paenibacillus castaneae]|uniref:hypothetical protein n=1 Tax=Paenibacillus castaneae TaxID=474957 RepID=UPI000C9AF126|nr:hypothetical protein [Paenibacillus castaneae]NIK79528.1 hypothetical protein [Paenibacillus castaneae]